MDSTDLKEQVGAQMDTFWILNATIFVFFMQAGFALLESGSVREKNSRSILLKNLLDACIGGLAFYSFGYALAFGVPNEDDSGHFLAGRR